MHEADCKLTDAEDSVTTTATILPMEVYNQNTIFFVHFLAQLRKCPNSGVAALHRTVQLINQTHFYWRKKFDDRWDET